MKEYLDYDQKYPDLIVRLVQFFNNNSKGSVNRAKNQILEQRMQRKIHFYSAESR